MAVKPVELNEPEKRLLAQVHFELSPGTHDAEAARANGEAARELAISLIKKKAIPEARLRWFEDPAYNIGGHGKSRRQVFEGNGTRGENIFRHANFLKHLRYFIYGPDLPASVIKAFEGRVAACGRVSSGDILPLRDYARQQARTHRLDPGDAAEEFYKLAIECGLDASEAGFIRNAVKRSRRL